MIIEILTIGDEILSGNILDTNKQYLSDQSWSKGLKVAYHSGVCDDEKDIHDALLLAADRADVVLCTGGLGPTMDDFTVEVAAKTFGAKLIEHEPTIERLKAYYEKRGRAFKENSRKQGMIPEGGNTLTNDKGTAPGVHYLFKNTHFYFMPGVPSEMKKMFPTTPSG